VPNLIKRMLRQDAVLWTFTGEDEFGNKTYADPVQIKVRWEDKTEQFLDRKGNTQVSRAQVYVDRKIEERSALWKGTLAEVESTADPFANDGAYEVRAYSEQPDFKARRFLRFVML
jgi:hypothetical protein